ncbi:MAG TPA: hypothetical protein VEA44_13305, partial [Caulobacter sp.]|nr:hypothetical protein [Caulobacter sp.]
MRPIRIAAAMAGLVLLVAAGALAQGSDPFLWLEEVEGARALAWVKGENAKAEPVLTGDRRFAPLQAEA